MGGKRITYRKLSPRLIQEVMYVDQDVLRLSVISLKPTEAFVSLESMCYRKEQIVRAALEPSRERYGN
jgi:hypothetical protein